MEVASRTPTKDILRQDLEPCPGLGGGFLEGGPGSPFNFNVHFNS